MTFGGFQRWLENVGLSVTLEQLDAKNRPWRCTLRARNGSEVAVGESTDMEVATEKAMSHAVRRKS